MTNTAGLCHHLRKCILKISRKSLSTGLLPDSNNGNSRLFGVFSMTLKRSYSTGEDKYVNRQYVPRRAVMYIPGHDLKKLRKIPALGVDCAVLECEDGVALNQKSEARKNICQMLDEINFVGIDCAVRINSVSSGLMEEDMRVIFQAEKLPQTILLPKVDTVQDLEVFTDCFRSVTSQRTGYCPYLITYTESAQGVLNVKEIFYQARSHSVKGVYHLDGVVFGSDDFCADIGAERTYDSKELLYVRQKIVLVAKAYRLQAIDMVFTDIKDNEALRLQCLEGARKGYTGKQVIHPGQVPVVQEAFTPSDERILWAKELVKSFEHHQEAGKGAFTFRGHMIDMPLLLQAKNILKIVENIRAAN